MIDELITSLRSRFDIVCSTDVVGLFGNPLDAYTFWRSAIPETHKFGLEVIAFSHQLALAKKLTNIAGFHARCDSLVHPRTKEYIMRPVNALMASPNTLINSNIGPVYINTHNLLLSEITPPKRAPGVYLVCENDNQPDSFNESLELGKKYEGNVYDIVHYCTQQQKVGWEKHLDAAIEKIYEVGQCLVHISWGWTKRDALPEDLSDTRLKKIGEAIKATKSFPVLEFQWELKNGTLGCNPSTNPKKVKNASEKILRLIDSGIIRKV